MGKPSSHQSLELLGIYIHPKVEQNTYLITESKNSYRISTIVWVHHIFFEKPLERRSSKIDQDL
jgi:hypothetical protein